VADPAFLQQAGVEEAAAGLRSTVAAAFAISPLGAVLALLYAIIMGLRRINKTDILQYNGAFLEMLGLKRFPDQSTLRRFLKRLSAKSIR